MPPPFFLYGSSPDALAAQQQGYEQSFTRAAEGNRAAAMQAEQASLQAFLQQQQRDDIAREADNRSRQYFFQNQQSREDALRNDAENRRRYDIELGMKRDAMNRGDFFDRNVTVPTALADLDLKRAQADNSRTYNPIQLKQLEFSHNRAAEDAASGNINSVQEAMRLYPGLTPVDAENYFRKSQDVRRQIDSEDKRLRSAANVMNQSELISAEQKKLKDEGRPGWIRDFFTPGALQDNYDTREKAMIDKAALLAPRVTQIQGKNGLGQMLDFEDGRYTPAIPQRSWNPQAFFGGNTTTGTTPQPKYSASQYVTGQRYGNMRYLGGDPNDQRNWKPINEPSR